MNIHFLLVKVLRLKQVLQSADGPTNTEFSVKLKQNSRFFKQEV